ncbi:MAG: Holliday junction resolvase RuvX [Phycisphaerales bacterium]|jgi:putative pre-16S rRNA nuclease
MRILAIDLGDQRTGLARADRITNIASPAGLVEVPIDHDQGNRLLDALKAHITPEPMDAEIIIGMPLNMDDTIGPRAKLVKAFAQRLSDSTNRPIILVDERRTSVAADGKMSQTGLTHKQKKMRRDAIAAAAIAEAYLSDPDSIIETLNPAG